MGTIVIGLQIVRLAFFLGGLAVIIGIQVKSRSFAARTPYRRPLGVSAMLDSGNFACAAVVALIVGNGSTVVWGLAGTAVCIAVGIFLIKKAPTYSR